MLKTVKFPLLSFGQLDKLADIFINVGTLFFGSFVISIFIPSLDKPSLPVVLLGLIFSLTFWILAIRSAKKI